MITSTDTDIKEPEEDYIDFTFPFENPNMDIFFNYNKIFSLEGIKYKKFID